MAHPQVLAQLLGRPLPPQPGEAGAAGVPVVAPAMQPRPGQEAAQDCRVVRVGRWSIDCVRHGRVPVDECTYPTSCPRRGEGM